MIYKDYQRNHVVIPGREKALESFLKQDYKGMQHKLKNAVSSNKDIKIWIAISATFKCLYKKTNTFIARFRVAAETFSSIARCVKNSSILILPFF